MGGSEETWASDENALTLGQQTGRQIGSLVTLDNFRDAKYRNKLCQGLHHRLCCNCTQRICCWVLAAQEHNRQNTVTARHGTWQGPNTSKYSKGWLIAGIGCNGAGLTTQILWSSHFHYITKFSLSKKSEFQLKVLFNQRIKWIQNYWENKPRQKKQSLDFRAFACR